jgi:TPR repeat protein
MLKRPLLLISLLAIALVGGCSNTNDLITPNAGYDFHSAEEQRQFEKRAMAGDIEAARRLANYYMFWHYDRAKALYWLRVAAAHGDAISKKNIRTLTEED